MSRKIRLLLGGATAVGKTPVALALARRLGLEILGCDSGQLRRGMSAGTAAPSPADLALVPHHLIGVVDPREAYSVAQFLEEARALLATPGPDLLAVGGTGQYLSGLWRGIDPVPAPDPALRRRAEDLWDTQGAAGCLAELSRLGSEPPRDASNPQRMTRSLERAWALERGDIPVGHPPLCPEAPVFALGRPREILHQRIHARLLAMLPRWREEVSVLRREGIPEQAPGLSAIGYRDLWEAPNGPLSRFVIERIAAATRQYGKRQETWLRTQLPSRWIEASDDPEADATQIAELLS